MAPDAAGGATWFDEERPLRAAGWAQLRRLGRRAAASWPIWLVAALLASGLATFIRARKPPIYIVTAVLRVTEGPLRTPDQLAQASLRAHVRELTFTRARLAELMQRHPREFPEAAEDMDAAFEAVRERILIDVSGDDMIGQSADADPARSARISLGFIAGAPDVAWNITHELADLLIDTALARQRAALLRAQAAAESEAQRADDAVGVGTALSRSRLRAADERAASTRLVARAAEQKQTLRFELVDPGRMPVVAGKGALVGDFFVTFAVALLAAALLAGAFDPRILGADDLLALRIPVLGELPRLPPGPPPPAAPPT